MLISLSETHEVMGKSKSLCAIARVNIPEIAFVKYNALVYIAYLIMTYKKSSLEISSYWRSCNDAYELLVFNLDFYDPIHFKPFKNVHSITSHNLYFCYYTTFSKYFMRITEPLWRPTF